MPGVGDSSCATVTVEMHDLVFRVGKLFLLTMIVLSVGFISFFSAMKWVISGQEVVVPSLVGQDLQQTRKMLAPGNLQLMIRGERYDRSVVRGRVSTQLPAAGARIKKGNIVNVIVSLGNRTNPIPDLQGSTLRAAQLLLAQQGFELGGVSEIHVGEGDPEQVVTQFPTSAATELVGNRIDILVDKGAPPRLYLMPDLTGWDLNRALIYLERAKIKVAEVTYGVYQDAPTATVVRQVPEAGYPLREGEAVRLEVSR